MVLSLDPPPPDDGRLHWGAPARNGPPIAAALGELLPATARVLEVASGSGQHAARMTAAYPGWTWTPSDPAARHRESIAAWRAYGDAPGFSAPLDLDVVAGPWPDLEVDAVFASNLLHIAPWAVTPALMAGAAGVLVPGGRLVVYGPFKVGGEARPESNRRFDEDLKSRNPAWGLRDIEAVDAAAREAGLTPGARREMPANNLLVEFVK